MLKMFGILLKNGTLLNIKNGKIEKCDWLTLNNIQGLKSEMFFDLSVRESMIRNLIFTAF